MKCTDRKKSRKQRWGYHDKIKQHRIIKITVAAVCVLVVSAVIGGFYYVNRDNLYVTDYESDRYRQGTYQAELLTDYICISEDDMEYELFQIVYDEESDGKDEVFVSAGLFDVDDKVSLYADDVHQKIYPASTTKILTAYIALKYGNLDDIITVGEDAMNVPWDSSKVYLKLGDQLTLEDLLYGLMLASGNDSAAAIAEYISGSQEAFAELMNEEARKMGAIDSNFVNPHGYHDDDHYTTAYDLYLILNQCIQNETFLEIVSTAEYKAEILQADGTTRTSVWNQTNQFINGEHDIPEGVIVIGGKTGTTDEAGSCLALYVTDTENNPYISVVMGADTKFLLYENMYALISTISAHN